MGGSYSEMMNGYLTAESTVKCATARPTRVQLVRFVRQVRSIYDGHPVPNRILLSSVKVHGEMKVYLQLSKKRLSTQPTQTKPTAMRFSSRLFAEKDREKKK